MAQATGEPTLKSSKHIGVGCVGVGGRGQYLLRCLNSIETVDVLAVCDTEPKNRAAAIKILAEAGKATPKELEHWDELAQIPEIAAVVSALPCDLHKENYLAMIAAGKDLYGEKPMCLSVPECNAVVEAANNSKQIVQIGFQRRADPRFIEPMTQVHNGELGELVEGRVEWSNAWGPLYGWFGQAARSGDWMVEQAVHNWDVMNWANQCQPVRAMGLGRKGLYRAEQPDRDVTDYYSALVEYANGVVVNMLHSWVSPGQTGHYNRAFNDEFTRLIGTKAGIDFNSGVFSYRRELNKPDRKGHHHEGEINGSLLSLETFIDSVVTRKPPVANVEHGRDAVLTCLLVREAVKRGGVVTMDELKAGE